ncbi:MAG: patatin-like phospholipase family protein, partial [Pseudomonadota bacterium]|nr:patatin-like phospholipase family protein [Pseudomonadota bacterium]
MTEHVSHITLFSELPRPFKAIATDIVTGEMVVLDHGELAVVMRASMGVPAVFAPREIEGRLLVDGGVTNNLPVDIARDMGADILIVVDITTPMLDREHIGDIITITDQLTRLLVVNNTEQQKKRMQADDILLIPALGEFSAAAFTGAAKAIEIGYQEAQNKSAELSQLVLMPDEYQLVARPVSVKPTIRSITVENTSGLDDEVIRSAIDFRIGELFNLKKVSHDMNRIHGTGYFEMVSYQLDQDDGQADLKISAKGKTWGPDYLHFGFNLDSEFKHDSRISFLLGYSREELTANGAEWITLAGIGDEPRLQTGFYLPLNPQRDWFVYADAEYRDDALYLYDGEKRSSTYALRKTAGSIGFGYEYGSQWRLMLGLNRTRGRAHAVTGEDFTSGSGFDEASINLQYVFDTRDDVDFPSSGSIVEAKVASYTESLGSDHSFNQWHLRAGHYFERKQHNLGLNLYLG